MKQFACAAVLPAVMLLAGCGGNTTNTSSTTNVTTETTILNEETPDENMTGGENATAAMLTGRDFANTVAASDAFEIEAAKLAQTKATSQDLKDFAAMMIRDHTESTKKLKVDAAKAAPPITPDPSLTDEQKNDLDTLRDATGVEFDTAYKSQQVTTHQSALSALQAYGQTGDVAPLRDFAKEWLPTIQKHFDKIKAL